MLNPTELKAHERVRDSLNAAMPISDFFLWLSVTPGEGEAEPSGDELDDTVAQIQEWVAQQDADVVIQKAGRLPELTLPTGPYDISVRAIPKKPEARGRSAPVVGNPVPAFAYWLSG